jgi:hypothetical protein
MARHFYRCLGCLEIAALDGDRLPMDASATVATCANCDQRFEYMGRVERDRLVQDRVACKCDDRCTSARGPLCVCMCGGKNHGAGLMGYVLVSKDVGSVPKIQLSSTCKAREAKRQYQAAVDLRAVLRLELDALLDRRRAGEYLPRPNFDRLRELQDANLKSWKARTHAARLKALRAVVTLPPADPIADVAAAVTSAIQTAAPLAEVPFSLTPIVALHPGKQTSLF